jgi:hypothetical protein
VGLQGSESDTKILSKVRGMPVEQAVTMVRDKIEQKLSGGVPPATSAPFDGFDAWTLPHPAAARRWRLVAMLLQSPVARW